MSIMVVMVTGCCKSLVQRQVVRSAEASEGNGAVRSDPHTECGQSESHV